MFWPRVDRFFAIGPSSGASAQGAVGEGMDRAFAEEGLEGLRLATKGRVFALMAIMALLPIVAPYPDFVYYIAFIVLFIIIGIGQFRLARLAGATSFVLCILLSLDFVLLSFVLIYPNPIGDEEGMIGELFDNSGFMYFYVFLALLALNFRPSLVLVGGLVGAGSWVIGIYWLDGVIGQAIAGVELVSPHSGAPGTAVENLVDRSEWFESRMEEAVIFVIVAALLAIAVQRSRQLLIKQVHLARERNNLARHFPSTMVESLAQRDNPLKQGRELVVSVLFADVIGFTKWAEGRPSEEVIELLREVHDRFESLIFDHEGTLNKFIGDGVMATFGLPKAGPQDAPNALRCAFAMLADFDRWNEARRAEGLEPVRISIGVHTGPVVMGDIGSKRQLELAVLGDTVNLASRLESLTRDLGCRFATSEATVEAVRNRISDGEAETLLAGLQRHGLASIRGRGQGIVIWKR